MGAGGKIQTFNADDNSQWPRLTSNSSVIARNLRKSDLGGVIFGCKHNTMTECLSKQLFGLPHAHFSYVQNIEEGLPLFLFNYSNRKLHGIYEAASRGQMSYDPYAWTDGGAERTQFPAQVCIRMKTQCPPLSESQFSEVIQDNYYIPRQFWFELDHAQTRGLIALFNHYSANIMWPPVSPYRKEPSSPLPAPKWKAIETNNDLNTGHSGQHKTSSAGFEEMDSRSTVSDWEELVDDSVQNTSSHSASQLDGVEQTSIQQQSGTVEVEKEKERVVGLLQKVLLERTRSKSLPKDCTEHSDAPCRPKDVNGNNELMLEHPPVLSNRRANTNGSDHYFENAKVMRVSTLSNGKKGEHFDNSTIYSLDLKHGITQLFQVVDELKEKTSSLEQRHVESEKEMEHLRSVVKDAGIEIQQLKLRVKELESIPDASSALVDPSFDKSNIHGFCSEDVIYLIGGFNGNSWLSSLDSFSPVLDVLTPLRSMSCARAYAPSVALDDMIYVLGGGDGTLWYDSVEYYNRSLDEWTSGPSMLSAKGSLAGAKINGKVFAIGGGDGVECFSDVDMLDPALGKWLEHRPMLHTRFAPAAAALEGAIYVVGGYDGNDYLRSVERFDPREGLWTELPSMNVRRGCHSLAILNEKLYCMGGYDGESFVSSMEIFDPRLNYWVMGEPMKFVRGFAAAAVLGDSLFAIGGVKDDKLYVDTVECYKEGVGWTASGWKAIGERCFCSAVVL